MTDWFLILNDLKCHDMNMSHIAKEVGVCERTVYCWANGTEPPHCKGELLIEIHRLVTGKDN